MTDKIYEFSYTDCIYECGGQAVSLHKTKKGAETAMYLHKENERKKWEKMYGNEAEQTRQKMKFGEHCAWDIYERELLE